MILEVTIVDSGGNPIGGAEVSIVNDLTGYVSSRYADGNGYTNHLLEGTAGTLCTFTTNGYSFTASTAPAPEGPMYYKIPDAPAQSIELTAQPFKQPFKVAPRFWKAQMCGLRILNLPPVAGGASDPTLFLSWFYGRYTASWRTTIRLAMKDKGYTHWVLSWPDERAAGCSPERFGLLCRELIKDGFYPCPFLYSKDYDPTDFAGIMANIQPVLPHIIGLVPLVCIGWELSIALSPATVQLLIDALAPQFTPAGTRVYVHFQQGYFAFEVDRPGATTADFWKLQVGKLTGVLYQRVQTGDPWDKPMFQARLADCTSRCAGNFYMPTDSGFGHPFDTVALEITAVDQFNGAMSEAEGNTWGDVAIDTPGESGPAGVVFVQGSGNGAT